VAVVMQFRTPVDGVAVRMAVTAVCYGAIWIPVLLWARRVATAPAGAVP